MLRSVHHNNITKYIYVGMVCAGIGDPSIALTESSCSMGEVTGENEISLMGNIETTVLEFFDIYGTDSAYFSRDASSPDISLLIPLASCRFLTVW